MNSKISLTKAYFNLDIIQKFEKFEEIPSVKPLLLVNRNGKVLYSNSSYQKNPLLNNNFNLFDYEAEPDFKSIFENLINSDLFSFNCDLLVKHNEDIYISYIVNIERVILEEKDYFIIIIDSQDNRERLNKKLNTFSFALESVDVGVLIADKEEKVKFISTSFEKILNVKLEQAFNKTIPNLFSKYLSDYEIEDLESALHFQKKWVKVISDISNEGDVSYKEFKLSFIRNSYLNTESFIITANDITEHINQTRLLKKSERKQKSIINNISDPILILKREKGKFIIDNANESFLKNIADKKGESRKNEINKFLPAKFLNQIKYAIENLENKSKIHTQFHYHSSLNNKRYLGKITYTDDKYDNSRIFIVNMTDITEQFEIEKRLREAYKKEIRLNKLKSTFLANMSHEIRTPLNAIVGYSDLLEDDVKQMNYESSTQMTSFLKEGVNRLLKLVDNIVEVSLLESGDEDIKLELLDINEIIQSNKKFWYELAKTKNLRMHFELFPGGINTKVNREKFEKALKEIVDNAVKYNVENGSVKISTFKEQNCVSIQISDTGIGIEKENLSKIFKIFSQAEEVGYTRKYEGAGIGLSLAKKLISFMNGKVNILSKPNEGTIITVSFPLEK